MCSQYCPRFRRFPSICHCQRSWKSPSALASLRPVSLGVPPYSQSPTMDRGSYAFALVADICWHPQCRKCHLRITDRSRYGSPVPRVVAFASRGSMAEWPKREWLAEEEETMAVQQRMTAVAMEATTTAEALRSPVVITRGERGGSDMSSRRSRRDLSDPTETRREQGSAM